jgi:hypothetical protein
MDSVYHIFVGYDEREHEPFQVAKHTLEKYAKVPIKVHKLHHKPLREQGLFTREWEIDKAGQYYDKLDEKPFSTQFSHTRFIVPELWRNMADGNKAPLVMFVDCDFLWRADIGEMFKVIEDKKLRENTRSPLYCVKHDYNPENTVKMDNIIQARYNKKLWSAMIVWDMDHPENELLTPEEVNTQTGRWLHNFMWIKDDHTIGDIPEKWHFIPDHSEKNSKDINVLHWTNGGVWFPNYRNCRYGDIWWEEYNDYLLSKISNIKFKCEEIIDGS